MYSTRTCWLDGFELLLTVITVILKGSCTRDLEIQRYLNREAEEKSSLPYRTSQQTVTESSTKLERFSTGALVPDAERKRGKDSRVYTRDRFLNAQEERD